MWHRQFILCIVVKHNAIIVIIQDFSKRFIDSCDYSGMSMPHEAFPVALITGLRPVKSSIA